MQSTWRDEDLPEIVATLARRPGREVCSVCVAEEQNLFLERIETPW
jgi:hypothetical protein